jgi:hypothetical protein
MTTVGFFHWLGGKGPKFTIALSIRSLSAGAQAISTWDCFGLLTPPVFILICSCGAPFRSRTHSSAVLTQSGSPKLWWRRRQARGCACTNWILRMSPCGPCADMASVAAISSSRNRMRASDDCQLICSIPRDTHLTIGELSYPCILPFLPPNFPITRDHLHSFRARTRHAKIYTNRPSAGL